MDTVRIVIELEDDESDTVVVQVTRKRAQATAQAEVIASPAEDAGPAQSLSAAESDAVEVNDAGAAPDTESP
ncbi:hypothetical protein JOF56_007132 [Kibdelosporangium banguiense]|uniref:Uncharacterized protein n=1 Tax=Kibdelosporangium banguiense TaxID=1365924 RepID=A0ABS4TQQ3_9PSEU|nr:hypothetical protein [Kibdelosporangium banguiense]MBP2326747.1 hypothetical protein [Kibdelosporangium banguiense]